MSENSDFWHAKNVGFSALPALFGILAELVNV
jgi:hypothetical protein